MQDDHLLRVGFVGAGGHATNAIYPSLRFAPIELVAIADLDVALATRNARRFGGNVAVFGSHRELLDRADVDAVFVVGHPAMHHSVGLDVLESGRHLFVEKPPGVDLGQAEQLRDAAARVDRQVMVGFMKRFASAYRHVWTVSRQKAFGTPRLLTLDYAHVPFDGFRDHLLFMSVHPFDTARWLMGDVLGGTVHRRTADGIEVLVATLDHAAGGVSQLNISSCAPRVQERLVLYGDNTMAAVDNFVAVDVQHRASSFAECLDTTPTMADRWTADLTLPAPANDSLTLQGYAGEVEHFATAILEGGVVSPSIADGVAALGFVEAVARCGQGTTEIDLSS